MELTFYIVLMIITALLAESLKPKYGETLGSNFFWIIWLILIFDLTQLKLLVKYVLEPLKTLAGV